MKVALVQMPVTADKKKNLQAAAERIHEAAENGADLVVLPEMFCCPYSNACFPLYAEECGGMIEQTLAAAAKENGVWLVGGSYPEREGDRLYNTSPVFDRAGKRVTAHRKVHLFDIDVEGGQRFMESDTLSAGDRITTFVTEFGPMGLCICFDLRFEELARLMCLRGAVMLLVPAAFNMTTGPAHWELLFRQRAVDNQCFTVGVSPARDETADYRAWGHSIAVDPWGTILCQAEEKETILYVEPDLGRMAAVRKQLPILSARRTDLYEVKEA